VEGAGELPAPEPLSVSGEKENTQLIELFGSYVVRCYCSRTWSLREAALIKMAIELPKLVSTGALTRSEAFIVSCGIVCDIAQKDRIANMFVCAVDTLLPAALQVAVGSASTTLRRTELTNTLDPVITAMLDKLGDNSAKVREAAVNAFMEFALPPVLGASPLAAALLRRPNKKQASNTRGLQSRLEVLTLLIEERKLLVGGGSGGVGADALVSFCVELGTFSHANGEIRAATLQLMTAAYKVVGRQLEDILFGEKPILRPKQRQEYEAAFAAGLDGAPVPTGPPDVSGGGGGRAPPQKERPPPQAQQKAAPGGKSGKGGGGGGGGAAPSAPPPLMPPINEEGNEEEEGEEGEKGTCDFCGWGGGSATEEALDLHYWQECPFLMACTRCTQVIEISTLPEHLLTECSNAGEYVACQTCGMVRRFHPQQHFHNSSVINLPPRLPRRMHACAHHTPTSLQNLAGPAQDRNRGAHGGG